MKENKKMGRIAWQAFESSIFSHMTQLAQKHQAVNLAQGFPDFDGPDVIKDAAIQAIKTGKNQYAPSFGILELREKLSERQVRRYGVSYRAEDEVTVFSGATEALLCTIIGLCEPGDEIVCFEPFFDTYPAVAMLAGAKIKTVALNSPDWTFDYEALKAQISDKTKLLLLNTPHNPTGKVFSLTELEWIADLAKQYSFIVVTDEVYEELTFSPASHRPFASLPNMRERTVCISSTSKTFSMTGWKIGYAFAPPELTRSIRIPHQYTVFCSATPLQWGMLAALNLSEEYFEDFRQEYGKRRLALYEMLKKHGFQCQLPDGSYFIMADYSGISDLGDLEFAKTLTIEGKVASIPVSGFYLNPEVAKKNLRYVRFGFCKNLSTIEAADRNLTRYFASASSMRNASDRE